METAVPTCERRRLFLTPNGFLGLAPDTVREGDMLAVLSGGDTPFLLRPIREDERLPEVGEIPSAQSNRYLLVGECFMHGLMQGEVVIAADRTLSMSGPVPKDLVHQETVRYGNKPEEVPKFCHYWRD